MPTVIVADMIVELRIMIVIIVTSVMTAVNYSRAPKGAHALWSDYL